MREAASAGYPVIAVSRSEPAHRIPDVTYLALDISDSAFEAVIPSGSVIVGALAPRGDDVGTILPFYRRLLAHAAGEGHRLIVIGGSTYGIRSLSAYHKDNPYSIDLDGSHFRIQYEPAESNTGTFGGNSNWRGPIWFPANFLLIEALQRLSHYYGDSFGVVFPVGSNNRVSLATAARLLSQRLVSIFLPDAAGNRPVFGEKELFQKTPGFKNYVLFYEYFHGDSGEGLGASHQTGWTGLVAKLLQQSGGGMSERSPIEPDLEYTTG